MPSKGKKSQPRASPNSTSAPGSPSTPAARRPGAGDDEALLRRRLPEVAAKFPAFISDTAFLGRIAESETSHGKGSHARVWLSEAAMVSSSLQPGSLVTVSLAASGKNAMDSFPLDSLVDECAEHFGLDVGDKEFGKAGCYFAIAAVFPSRKVVKNGVKLSWGLSCTIGFPATGRVVFVFPLGSQCLENCKDLHLYLVPPKAGEITRIKGSSSTNSLTEVDSISSGNGDGNDASPKTPLYQSKISPPGTTPSHSRKVQGSVPNLDSCLDVSAARLALADEKVNELLETYAARWLYSRYLLSGNFVSIPIWGHICLFLVESAVSQNLMHDVQISNSLYQVDVAVLVDAKTKVHLSESRSLVGEMSSKAGLSAGDFTGRAIKYKESSDIPKLGGLSRESAALKEIIMFSLKNKEHLPRYKGVLLHGPPGTGKTSLASYCAWEAGINFFSINGPEIISQYYGESEQALHEVFDSARQAAPAVVFIDELDAIAPARKDGGEELSLRMVATLLKLMDEINRADRLLVIAATNRPDSVDPALRRPGRLDREIEIGVPSPEQRLDILHTLLSQMDHSLNNAQIQSLALATHGFVGADLAALCNEAAMTSLRRYIEFDSSGRYFKWQLDSGMQGSDAHKDGYGLSIDDIESLSSSRSDMSVSARPVNDVSCASDRRSLNTSQCQRYRAHEEEKEKLLSVTAEDFEKAKLKVRPSAMREVMLELPKVCWEDVGGQKKIKKQLIEAVQWPQLCPDAFKRIGIRPPRGLLMIGPPGCSKTLMARAVASEAKLNFLAVKGPELFNKWVGESEKAVRSLFAKARANSPAIIFFDEIDGLAVARGQENDGTSVADRVLSQLLVEMDGLDQRVGVTVIAATNRPDKIDHALLRPGRFDRLLDVQPPDEGDREDVFRIHMRNIPCSLDVCIKDLACLTEGYTGADIKLICREAAIAALEESLEISVVSMKHFRIGIEKVQPSDVQFYQELAEQFRRLVDSGSA